GESELPCAERVDLRWRATSRGGTAIHVRGGATASRCERLANARGGDVASSAPENDDATRWTRGGRDGRGARGALDRPSPLAPLVANGRSVRAAPDGGRRRHRRAVRRTIQRAIGERDDAGDRQRLRGRAGRDLRVRE